MIAWMDGEVGAGAVETLRATSLQITYSELNKQSNRLAGILIEKGVLPDDIIALQLERSNEMIISILGVLKSGAAYMPINPKQPEARTEFMLKDSRAKLIINYEFFKKAPQASFLHHSSFIIQHSNHLCYVIYTSGSTGKPKGVPITHANFSPLIHWGYKNLGINENDRVIQNLSYYFDWSVLEIFLALTTGASLHMISESILLNPEAEVDFILKNTITVLHITPTQYGYLLNAGKKLKPLKYLFIGAEKLTFDLGERSIASVNNDCRIFNMYGPTETTIISAVLEIDKTKYLNYKELTSVPIGRASAGLLLVVLNKYGQLCPVKIVGELHIAGPGVANGYLNNPELTAERFKRNVISQWSFVNGKSQTGNNFLNLTNDQCPMTNDHFYCTGDLVRWLPGGVIEFLGRIDHQVKVRGFRIEMGEIENQLLKHTNIKEAVVLVNEDGDKSLIAYIVPNTELMENKLREYLRENLPDYMIPSYFVQLEKIPLTPNGKLDRKALPKPQPKTCQSYIAPRDEIEKKMTAIWSEVLDQTSIGIDYNFFHLGGHSLKATILISKINKIFQVNVPLAEIFKTPTIRNLSNYIKTSVKEKYLSIEFVEKQQYYSLSSAQKRLYILHQMDQQEVGYNISYFSVLEGYLVKDKLEHIFRLLINRHEGLRTSFHMINDEPVQRIHDEMEFEIEYLTTEGTEKVGTADHFIRPFDLSKAPLLRVRLVKEKKDRHILMVDMHHVISDGTSINILVKDFMALYQDMDLSELQLQYKDFSNWQKNEKHREALKRQEEYWLNEFAGEIPVLELPANYPRPAVQSFEGNRIPFEISKETTGVLQTLALELGATVYMVLLSLYTVFLTKVTNQEDILIGSPIAGRRHVDLKKIIGMFVNTMVLRNYPSREKTFSLLLQEIKEKTLKAFENQDYQYEDLVEKIAVTRDISRNPLFDTMFVLQNMEIVEINIPGLKLSPYPYENKTAKFDLTLTAVEAEEKLLFNFEYSTKLFKEETIDRFITYFKKIVNGVIENKDRRISDFEIITEEEKKKILFDFNDTEAEYPKDKTIHQLLAEQAIQTPDNIAVFSHGQTRTDTDKNEKQITYYYLNQQAGHLAG
ncbi:MAG: amino acid adenylation domain-containing protein, partial [Acidobacteria bacterium]|nr:amino acid adenylation domain-containing protein [Acidobacteriota bacterium]